MIVTVLELRRRTKAVVHDDGAGPHTRANGLRKACASITFKSDSGDSCGRIGSTPPPHAALVLDEVAIAQGALPIHPGNDIVGAIGMPVAPG